MIAVNDGKVVKLGPLQAPRPLRDRCRTSTATRYTYGHLGSVAKTYPAPKPPGPKARPSSDTGSKRRGVRRDRARRPPTAAGRAADARGDAASRRRDRDAKVRLFAHPDRAQTRKAAGGDAAARDRRHAERRLDRPRRSA